MPSKCPYCAQWVISFLRFASRFGRGIHCSNCRGHVRLRARYSTLIVNVAVIAITAAFLMVTLQEDSLAELIGDWPTIATAILALLVVKALINYVYWRSAEWDAVAFRKEPGGIDPRSARRRS